MPDSNDHRQGASALNAVHVRSANSRQRRTSPSSFQPRTTNRSQTASNVGISRSTATNVAPKSSLNCQGYHRQLRRACEHTGCLNLPVAMPQVRHQNQPRTHQAHVHAHQSLTRQKKQRRRDVILLLLLVSTPWSLRHTRPRIVPRAVCRMLHQRGRVHESCRRMMRTTWREIHTIRCLRVIFIRLDDRPRMGKATRFMDGVSTFGSCCEVQFPRNRIAVDTMMDMVFLAPM